MTKNEAARLPRTLASIPGSAAILVIDAESTDATVVLARERGARVVVRPWTGFIAARRFALANVTTPWTFMLDADEVLDDALAASLVAADPASGTDGYAVARTTYFCGRPVRGGSWGAEKPLRLFRTGMARLEAHPAAGGSADVHETWHVPGTVAPLSGTLHHHSYPTLAAYRAKFARYTELEASGVAPSRGRLATALVRALVYAPWLFAARGGWRDGWRGAFIAVASASYPVVVAWRALRR